MINEKMEKALCEQIREELNSAYIYLAMAADFKSKMLDGFTAWMQVQSREEVGHAMRIFSYLNERGGKVVLKTIDAPQGAWDSPLAAFRNAYDHERHITGTIENLVRTARELKDTATERFLDWFVNEQVEEESNAEAVVKKLEMLGDSPTSIYLLDKELGARKAD